MGGYGSTRWGAHIKRQVVEACVKLAIRDYTEGLRLIEQGRVDSQSYESRAGGGVLLVFRAAGVRIEAKINRAYGVGLQTTSTAWGSLRYWWSCPVCGRRCSTIYLPPGARCFACRDCHNLAYTSSQESHREPTWFDQVRKPSPPAQREPGLTDMTPKEYAAFCTWRNNGRRGRPPKPLQGYWERKAEERRPQLEQQRETLAALTRAIIEDEERAEQARAARHSRYLSAGELQAAAGLTGEELARLEEARLLLPDREGRYRPKLAGWAGKLAYLLRAGWSVESIKAWARGRWSSADPDQWPPDLAAWSQGA